MNISRYLFTLILIVQPITWVMAAQSNEKSDKNTTTLSDKPIVQKQQSNNASQVENDTPTNYDELKEYITFLIEESVDNDNTPALSIALIDDQQIVWSQGFGFADTNKLIPATENTIYRVGSISKIFSVIATLKLFRHAAIDIDTPINQLLPAFDIQSRFPDAPTITTRHLMTHHSGIQSDILKGMWSTESYNDLLAHLKDSHLTRPPGEIYSYSNTGITLLGPLIEFIAGTPFNTYMQEHLFQPLSMKHSGFDQRYVDTTTFDKDTYNNDAYDKDAFNKDIQKKWAKGYAKGEERTPPTVRDLAAIGMYSSAKDLAQFIKMIFTNGLCDGRRVVDEQIIEAMAQTQSSNNPLDIEMQTGLGWLKNGINIESVEPILWHDGSTLLYNSTLIILPKHKLGLVVLANALESGPLVEDIAIQALELALEKKMGYKKIKETTVPDKITLSTDNLKAILGQYATPDGVFFVSGDQEGLVILKTAVKPAKHSG